MASDTIHPQISETATDDHEDLASSRAVCFGGVGRLYASQPLAASATTKKNAKVMMRPSIASASVLYRLQTSTVAVVGVGGVGSWAVEALCRSGVGNLILVDLDDICRSNTNRQLHALQSTVGRMKIDAMYDRLQDIAPTCNVTRIHDFVTRDNVHELLDQLVQIATATQMNRELDPLDESPAATTNRPRLVVLDAMDGSLDKAALVAACAERGISLVVCGGAAGRTDPTRIQVADLTRVPGDRLLFALRRNLRKYYGFPEGARFREKQPRQWKIPTVYSTQEPKASSTGDSSASSLRRCDSDLGTACFVTGTVGFAAAGCVVDMIVHDAFSVPLSGSLLRRDRVIEPSHGKPLLGIDDR